MALLPLKINYDQLNELILSRVTSDVGWLESLHCSGAQQDLVLRKKSLNRQLPPAALISNLAFN